MGITDYIDSTRSQGFLYDALNRLTQAQSSAYGTITYYYDEIGNMTYNSQVGSYTYWKDYFGTKPHAVYQAGSNTYQYDNNGNMTSSPGKTLTYDYDNRPVSISGTTFVYDFSGQRVKKNATIYIGKLYECTGGTCTKYIFAGGNRIAYKTGSAVYYYHTDHLGSSSIITNTSGTKVNELYYYPYGKTRYALDSSLTHKFTGQEEDEETGLYYYGARYYDPAIGRFVSADSIVPDFSDPQTLNRYSYCRNNPLIYTDPTGQAFIIDDILIGVLIGAVIGGTTSAITGGDILQGIAIGAIGGGFLGAASGYGFVAEVGAGAAAGYGIGILTKDWNPNLQFGAQVAGGGLISGGIAELSGGKFGQGFASGAVGAAMGYGMRALMTKRETIQLENESLREANYHLVVDNSLENTLNNLGGFVNGVRDYMGIFRATRNISVLYNDIIKIAYSVAENLGLGCSDLIRTTLFFNQTRQYNNFVYYDYKGYGLGHGSFLTMANYPLPIEIISHYGCDVHNPYFSMPILRQGI
jgi:RHS repeat-associated protein